ncbi:pilus assembly PilX family protein [Thermochromatium tepidum]|jgi:Tfp pilus assembly protein PilX|uniref:Pilus assembly protein n=1 Tax=Thermochromatium tepidum ATCC 43061 TaxID=316276 RepID=A0A6I6DYW5_THETI|nr:PilX N-terminal domain-containing pilus assembly protein [Thermochromatium tepidum]QGU32841.1 pilus assembly protein [Thermochromatium tepidum ATCC 43061]
MSAEIPASIRHQGGAALIVALLFLLLITLIGVTGQQNVALEERMSATAQDRNLAFQAAESALRQAESVAATKPTPGYTDADNTCPSSAINNCSSGVCPPPDKDCQPRWLASGFNGWANAAAMGIAGTPQYFIEYLGDTFNCSDGGSSDPKNCKRYRVTARSNPGAERASVTLQSIYATD